MTKPDLDLDAIEKRARAADEGPGPYCVTAPHVVLELVRRARELDEIVAWVMNADHATALSWLIERFAK